MIFVSPPFDHLPAWLQQPGPYSIDLWQWVALPAVAVAAFLLGPVLGGLAMRLALRLARRRGAPWEQALLQRLSQPIRGLLGLLAASWLLLPLVALPDRVNGSLQRGLHLGVLAVVFWGVFRLVDAVVDGISRLPWMARVSATRSLLPLFARSAKISIFALAAVAMLSFLGYPVASLVAGLGIGGVAIALAAQKTVENLFGSVSIAVDQPFQVGDFVKIEDFVGNVETIGLRSTRIRTLDRTLITIPNGRLSDMRTESFAARDRIRLSCTIGLVYETTAAQMRAVLAGFEQTLRAQPKIWPDAVIVRFTNFGASSLDVDVMAWFETSDWNEFQTIRQEVFLSFMEVVERAGSGFAFPTRTVHVVNASPT